jgi:hypothetical protein
LFQVAAKLVDGGRIVIFRHEVGHQSLIAWRVLAGHHDALLERRVTSQAALDLSQLDAKAADLDLMIDSTEVLELALFSPANQVARSVQPRTGRGLERIGDEFLGRQFRTVQIFPSEAEAA